MVILDYFLWTGEFYHDVKHWQNQYHSYISGIRASYLNRPLPSIDLDLWIENYFIKVQTIQYLHDLRHYQILNVYSRDLNISLVSCKTLCFFFLTGTQHNSVGLLHRFLLQQSVDSSISAWSESLPDPECMQPRFADKSTTHFTNVMWLCWCFLLQWICRISYKRSLFQVISV